MQNLFSYLLLHPSLVERPERVLMIAVGFAAAGLIVLLGRRRFRLRSWPCFAVAVLWALSAWWEAELRGKGYNIRVDLILLHPALTVLSLLAVAGVAWPRAASAHMVKTAA
ncbi:hypothetical protein AB0F81_34050 [Actinoplanes sp. NPDC024001]|uniref:hypothetical protein n=1 Tax=Actinoplanes sp. NPDC024001 TaxID=3154598 RepID=UPI003406927F